MSESGVVEVVSANYAEKDSVGKSYSFQKLVG